MNLYSLSGHTLFSSRQPTIKRALEEAVDAKTSLQNIDLRRARLRGARLDGLIAPGACLWGADLTRCDLADANLAGADLRMATLIDTCLADSDCTGCRFEGAYFKDVLMGGAGFARCQFSCPSILNQPLHVCGSLSDALYWHKGEQACALDRGLIRLQVPGSDILLLDEGIFVNGILQEEGESIFY